MASLIDEMFKDFLKYQPTVGDLNDSIDCLEIFLTQVGYCLVNRRPELLQDFRGARGKGKAKERHFISVRLTSRSLICYNGVSRIW